MSPELRKLYEEKNRILAEQRRINDQISADGRSFKNDERDRYKSLQDQKKAVADQIRAQEGREKEESEWATELAREEEEMRASASGGRRSVPQTPPSQQVPPSPQPSDDEQAIDLFALGDSRFPDADPDDPRATVRYHNAFAGALLSGEIPAELNGRSMAPKLSKNLLEAMQSSPGASMTRASNALQRDSEVKGGWLAASRRFSMDLIRKADEDLWVRGLGTFESADGSTEGLDRLTLASDFTDFEWTAELQEPTEDELSFGARSLDTHPLKKEVNISDTLLRKRGGRRALMIVVQRLRYKYQATLEYAAFNGDGNKKYLGIMANSEDGIPASRDVAQGNTPTEITFDGLKRLKRSVPARWRNSPSFTWGFHPDIVLEIDLIKDNDGRYVWSESVQTGEASRLLGKPVRESGFLPGVLVPGGYFGFCGDMKWYQGIDSLDFLLLQHEHFIREGLRSWIILGESDAMPMLAEAFGRGKLPEA